MANIYKCNENDGNTCTSLPVAGQVEADGPWPPHHSSLPQTIRYVQEDLLNMTMIKHIDVSQDPSRFEVF